MKGETITLFFRQGSADKVYKAALYQYAPPDSDDTYAGADLWSVNFAYGRRGGAMKYGSKTPEPVCYEMAKTAYDTLVKAKMKKGYAPKPGEGVAPPVTLHGKEAVQTDWIPQLLNEVTEAEALNLYGRFPMYLQIKHDGERRGVWFNETDVTAANRRGLETTIPQEIIDDLLKLGKHLKTGSFLDTEDMGSHLVIFDVLSRTPENRSTLPFKTRLEALYTIARAINELKLEHLITELPIIPPDPATMQLYITKARQINEEGVVIRDGNGLYKQGKPNSGGPCWKLKFWGNVTCLVTDVDPVKQSCSIEINDTSGKCTIPANYPKPVKGDWVEIRYLYAFPGGSLYQPQYQGVRTDITEEDFNNQKLKYKK